MALLENIRFSCLNKTGTALEVACPKISNYCKEVERVTSYLPIVLRVVGLSPVQHLKQSLENSLTDSSNILEEGVEWIQMIAIQGIADRALATGLRAIVRQTGKCAEKVLRSEFMESYRRGDFNNREISEIRKLLEGVGMPESTICEILESGQR